MTTEKWVPSGKNWMWALYVGDTQVIYVLFGDDVDVGNGGWSIVRKVSGSAHPSGEVVGARARLEDAKSLAEHDANVLQEKGL